MASDGLTRKLLNGLRWNTAGFVVQALAQVLFGIILARLLEPSAFGLMAIAYSVITPAFLLAEGGIGLALVQAEKIGPEEIKFSFWVQSCCGTILAVLVWLISPEVAAFFVAPELGPILVALSSAIVFQAFGLTALNLLRRAIDFRRLQIVQICAVLGSQLLVALPLALIGAGFWSLVAGAIANSGIASLLAYAIVRHEIGIGFSRHGFRLVRTSRWYLLLNIINAVQWLSPQMMMGRLLGVDVLGLFDRAYSLIVTPVDRGAGAATDVLFSFFSRSNEQSRTQREIFLSGLTIAVFLGAPLAAVTAAYSSLIVASTLGPKWVAAAQLLPPLSICIPLCLVLQTAVPVLNGRGRPEIEVGIVIAMICLFIPMAALLHRDVQDVVWILIGTYVFRIGCVLVSVKCLIGVTLWSMLAAIVPGLIAAVLLLLGSLLLGAALPVTWPSVFRLALVIVGSAAGLLSLWGAYYAWMPNALFRRALNA